jgi:hypothetical protein
VEEIEQQKKRERHQGRGVEGFSLYSESGSEPEKAATCPLLPRLQEFRAES